MKPTMYSKKAKKLPSRSGLNSLDRTQRTINDYSKLSPIKDEEPVPLVTQFMRKK
jgi:hypothetical protein